MSAYNFYKHTKRQNYINPNKDVHGIDIPFMMTISSGTGTGKTNSLLGLISLMNKTFHEIILCVKTANEPLYEHLISKLGNAVKVFEDGQIPPTTDFATYDEQTRKFKSVDKYQRLLIFDDLVLERSANMIAKEYYIKGRKLAGGISCVYISQSFYQIPKIIRENCGYFVLGKNLLRKDLRSILSCFPTDLTLDEFSSVYRDMTSEPLDTMIIDVKHRTARRNFTGDNIPL
jgi:hypothetical protein